MPRTSRPKVKPSCSAPSPSAILALPKRPPPRTSPLAKADDAPVGAVGVEVVTPDPSPKDAPPPRKGGWVVQPNGLWSWVEPKGPPVSRRTYTKPTGARAKAIAKKHSKAMKDYHRRRREEELAAGIVKAPRIRKPSKPNRSEAALARAAVFDRERAKDPDRKMQKRAAAARYREANREKLRRAAVDRRAGDFRVELAETSSEEVTSRVFALTAELVSVLNLLVEDIPSSESVTPKSKLEPNRSEASLEQKRNHDQERAKRPDRREQIRAAQARYRARIREVETARRRAAGIAPRAAAKPKPRRIELRPFALTSEVVAALKVLAIPLPNAFFLAFGLGCRGVPARRRRRTTKRTKTFRLTEPLMKLLGVS